MKRLIRKVSDWLGWSEPHVIDMGVVPTYETDVTKLIARLKEESLKPHVSFVIPERGQFHLQVWGSHQCYRIPLTPSETKHAWKMICQAMEHRFDCEQVYPEACEETVKKLRREM